MPHNTSLQGTIPLATREQEKDKHYEAVSKLQQYLHIQYPMSPSTHKPLSRWLCPATPQTGKPFAAPPRPYRDVGTTSKNLRIDSRKNSSLSLLWSPVQTQAYLVGSSKNMTGGLLTSSSAMARRFRWPPDRLPVRVLAQGSKPSAVKISLTCGQQTQSLY